MVSLVRHGLGVALIDEFSVADMFMPGLKRVPVKEPGVVTIHAVTKKGRALSHFAQYTIEQFRTELVRAQDDWNSGAN